MKTTLLSRNLTPLLTLLALLFSIQVYAQPGNDDCVNATPVTIGADEASCVPVDGTTVDATESTEPADVCSGSWFGDDIWFEFTTPTIIPEGSIIIKVLFGAQGGDVQSVGMALYDDCGVNTTPINCYSDDVPEKNQLAIYQGSLTPNHTYYVRIWSSPGINDNSGSLRVCAFYSPPEEDVVLWDGGQFDGGLGDWTTVGITSDTALWTHKSCACAAGTFRSQSIASPTAHNGAMVFDADVLNTGVTGSPPYPMHTGELISPPIDCSDFEAVSLKYFQSYEALNGNTYYSYSLDNGATWVDDIEVNADVAANDGTHIPSIQRFFIPAAAGVDSFRVKFIFDGDYYNWIIDDVQLIQPERNNLRITDFFAIAPNAVTPISQIEPFGFVADIYNAGSAEQTGVNLNLTIEDEASNEVFNEDLAYDPIPPDSLDADKLFIGYFTPDASIKSYSGTYEVTSDSVDFDPSDNVATFAFETSDTTFAKETGGTRGVLPAANNWDDQEPHSWAYGNHFYVVNGDDWWATSASFGLGNADATDIPGRLITIYLYKWIDEDENGDMEFEERERVGFAIYEILGNETIDDIITVPLLNFPSGLPGPIDLESNQDYVLMVEYTTNDQVDFALRASEAMDYRAMIWRTEQDGIPQRRYAGMLGVNGDLDAEPYSSLGFGEDIVPVVRLNIGLGPDNAEDILDEANLVEVSPNPANDRINLSVSLVETQQKVNVRILDVNGRLLMDQPFENIKEETIEIETKDFANGAYFLHFVTESGVRTERFIVQH